MPETKSIVFTHKEVAEALIKSGDIHEGLWGIYVEFGLSAANVGPSLNEVMPSAVVGIVKIGIQRFPEPSNLTVNAAEVNPTPKQKAEKK